MLEAEPGSLKHCSILEGVEAKTLAGVEAASTWKTYEVGEQICERGDTDTDLIFLVEGCARVLIHANSGQEIAFADVEAGGHFGELSLVDGGERSATVVAVDNCTTASVPRVVMLEVLRLESRVAINLLSDFARILRGSNERVVDLSTKSGIQRVYEELLRMAEPSPSADGSWQIPTIPMHKEIAIWAGTTTDTVARAIGQLTNVGIVKRRHRTLHIIDRRHIKKLPMAAKPPEPDEERHTPCV